MPHPFLGGDAPGGARFNENRLCAKARRLHTSFF